VVFTEEMNNLMEEEVSDVEVHATLNSMKMVKAQCMTTSQWNSLSISMIYSRSTF
jgi:hypothetical protein